MLKIVTILIFLLTVFNTEANEYDSLIRNVTISNIDSISSVLNSTDTNQRKEDIRNIEPTKGYSTKELKNDKSCSCLLQSILTIIGSVFTVLASLWIFYRQIKNDRIKENERHVSLEKARIERRNQETEKYWNYLLLVIDSIIENSRKQSEYCFEFSKNSQVISLKSVILQYAANYDLTRFLKSTDQKKLLIHFLNKSVDKDESILLFRELYKSLDFIKALIENIIETNKNYIQDLNNLKQDYSTKFENFKDELFSLKVFINENSSQLNEEDIEIARIIKEIFNTYFRVMTKAKEENKNDLNNVELHYELIVNKLLSELKDKFYGSRFHADLILKCKSVKFQFGKLQLTTNSLVDVFSEYANSLNAESERLKELKQKISVYNIS